MCSLQAKGKRTERGDGGQEGSLENKLKIRNQSKLLTHVQLGATLHSPKKTEMQLRREEQMLSIYSAQGAHPFPRMVTDTSPHMQAA